MKRVRVHAGYSRPNWRLRRGLAPDRLITRADRLDRIERHEVTIIADLREQLEAMFKRWPLELRERA